VAEGGGRADSGGDTGGVTSSGGITALGGISGAGGTTATGGTLGQGGAPATTCTICDGTCVDVQSDANNCGGCRNACSAVSPYTARCATGRCLATLATGQAYTSSIAVDEINVYWTNRVSFSVQWGYDDGVGTVMKLPLGGGTPTTLASGQYWPDFIVVDGSSAYWTTRRSDLPYVGSVPTDTASVMRVPLDGGTPTSLISTPTIPGQIAVDANSVYWAYPGTRANDFVDGAVVKVSLVGDFLTWLAPGQQSALGIAVDATSVYWTTYGTSSGNYSNGSVLKMPMGGGTITTLASGQTEPSSVVVDGTSAYWTNSCNPTPSWSCGVMKVPLGGGSTTTLASGQTGPGAITMDATSVYWVNYSDGSNSGGGSVMKMPLGGGTPTVLAAGQFRPNGMAVDATSVYWITEGSTGTNGTVMKLTPK
jgi:hypothetical protein